MNHKIFKNSKLPFVELRYADEVRGCTKSHTHDLITITAILSGEADLILSNKKEKLSYAKIAFLNPNTAHCVEVIDKNTKGDYVLHLDLDWCIKIQKELFSHEVYIPISQTIINKLSIYNDFITICDKLLSNTSLLEKEESVISFISEIFLLYCDDTTIAIVPCHKSSVTKQIKEYVDIKYQNDISLEELSNKFGLSVVHIIRLFKKEFDLPIHSYILNKKVHKARELLSTKKPLVAIALESGFYDQSHLNKSFKRVFSITPKEYQDNLSEC